ncbi:MAG: hypothetical protein FWD48_10665 [Oscillospiraceae bacterium]|nr:hypothetical protein [Oscillospiraceae bacterium]
MIDFTGALCPVCKKDFTNERPVVCPDCGAPYHRACYAENGECIFKSKHSAEFAWNVGRDALGTPNTSTTEAGAPEASRPTEGNEKVKNYYGSIRETLDEMGFFDNIEKEPLSPDERFIFGVSEKEIAYFHGSLSPLRLMRFRKIASGNKISLNVFAGIFSPLYMFYSRMRGLGALITALTFLLSFPTWLDRYFMLTNSASPFTQEELLRLSANMSLFSLSLTVLVALFYDYIYLRWSTNKIKFIRSRFFPEIMNDRPEIPDAPSVSPKLEGLSDDYYSYLRSAGNPGVRYMLMDYLIATMITFFLVHIFVTNFMA